MSERTMTQEIKETLEIIREALDHYSPLLDGVRLCRMQFLVIAVLSTEPVPIT